jgi:D-alanyl-D-alanine carboxypeptidase
VHVVLKPSRALLYAVAATALIAATAPASAEALLLIEAESGKVLHAENATYPWYPASVTKLMTAYVTLRAVKERRIKLDTLIAVSPNAAAQAPSKMGFKVGTQVTVDNALKMLMVKSANDIAVVLAEGVSGSIENFADEMNRTAQRLGMTQSSFVNPNGLPADGQITSARDMGILARAIYRELPEYDYWQIPAIQLGKKVLRNYNTLINRYPGADGMKTGFICASGFNLVASATRDGKRLIAVVLGAASSPVRAVKAAQLFERGFNGAGLSWLTPSLGRVESLQPIAAAPPNLRDEMCGKHRKRPAAEELDEPETGSSADSPQAFFLSGYKPGGTKPSALIGQPIAAVKPIPVYIGPPKASPNTQLASTTPAVAAEKPAAAAAPSPWPKVGATFAPAAALVATPSNVFAPSTAVVGATAAVEVIPIPRPRPKIARKPATPVAAAPAAAAPAAAR